MNILRDPHNRHIHKVRLSLLDACNFRCLYCMPQNPKFMAADKLLTRAEIFRISKILTRLGIDELRITGGEPTLRHDFLPIVEDLSTIGFNKLGLTTNGLKLKPLLKDLKQTQLKNINISLDGLNKKGFHSMTGIDGLENVLTSILTAKELGFNVKVNVVVLKEYNGFELFDFIDFSSKHNIQVRFLELMRIGVVRDYFDQQFLSADNMIEQIKSRYHIESIPQAIDSTSFNFQLDNGAQIGFIASESKPFCSGCSRLRISSDGIIRPCLMINDGFSLKGKNEEEILEILYQTMKLKPIDRIFEVHQSMNEIGG